jgi:glucose-1-phosphate thymidylyltransferase
VGTASADLWMDVVFPWDIITVNEIMTRDVNASLGGTVEKGATIKGPVFVGNDSKIYSGCYIVGPVVIGNGCEIGPNTCIFPSTIIGNNSVINAFCEIRNSIVMGDVSIGSNSLIYHSVVGRGCMIGGGFSSLSGKTTIEIEDEFIKLGNIGCIIGEDCSIGGHVVLNSGVIIGRGCEIGSFKKISVGVSSGSKVM